MSTVVFECIYSVIHTKRRMSGCATDIQNLLTKTSPIFKIPCYAGTWSSEDGICSAWLQDYYWDPNWDLQKSQDVVKYMFCLGFNSWVGFFFCGAGCSQVYAQASYTLSNMQLLCWLTAYCFHLPPHLISISPFDWPPVPQCPDIPALTIFQGQGCCHQFLCPTYVLDLGYKITAMLLAIGL